MSSEDHPSDKVSLDVSLSEKGISAKARLRTLAALDRLVGNLIDIGASKLEAVSNRIRARSDQEVRLIGTEGDLAKNILENDERLARIVTENYLSKQIKYSTNKLEVAERAIEYLSEEESYEEPPSEKAELEEDWLNCFEQYAERASSERMRDLWARVLAGEIRKPQSFSLVTLRFLSELDKDIASLFERETKYWIRDGFILKPEKMENQRLLDLIFLEEVGLLQEVNGHLQETKTPDDKGAVYWREGNLILTVGTKTEIKLPLIRITRIGREITGILPPRNYVEVLENVEKRIHNGAEFSRIEIIIKENNGRLWLKPLKVLKRETT